jgi:hypothetical protein
MLSLEQKAGCKLRIISALDRIEKAKQIMPNDNCQIGALNRQAVIIMNYYLEQSKIPPEERKNDIGAVVFQSANRTFVYLFEIAKRVMPEYN